MKNVVKMFRKFVKKRENKYRQARYPQMCDSIAVHEGFQPSNLHPEKRGQLNGGDYMHNQRAKRTKPGSPK